MVRSVVSMAVSAALAVAPLAAQAAPDRIAAPAAESEELRGALGTPGTIAAAIVFLLILYLFIEESGEQPESA